jgi:hypothetical protein
MKPFRLFAAAALTLALAPVLSAGGFGLRAGQYNESGEQFVGVEAAYDLGAISINPNIEYSLEDDVTAGTGNIDVLFGMFTVGRATPFLGAGVGLSYVDAGARTTTDAVGNLIGGIRFDMEGFEPYAQVKYFRVLGEEDGDAADDVALTVGVRF